MVSEERNALAELVERLDYDIGLVHTCAGVMNFSDSVCQDIIKAQRIIAELAKASDAIGYADEFAKDGFKDCIYIPATQQLCVKKILTCRAIAEEGEYNGNE